MPQVNPQRWPRAGVVKVLKPYKIDGSEYQATELSVLHDRDERPAYPVTSAWALNDEIGNNECVTFHKTRRLE